ncbi:MAG: TonB-dependent receptor, partial [Comamonadaceae bacterium]
MRPRHGAVAAAVLSLLQPAWAQTVADPAIPTLAPVTVSASGLNLGEDDMSTPVSVLEGEALVLRRGANLGDTLAGEPGVSASHFGAGASRPIIRGMDGPRVKVLADGVEIHDASTISPDHAVTSEPMLARQIEVLRGPSALIHGGGAVGGVVNVLDNRIPTRRPANGFEGSVELQGRSGAREAAGAFDLTTSLGDNLVMHLEGSRREAKDYRVGKNWSGGQKVP